MSEEKNCKCPICEGDVTQEVRDHVLKEIGKLACDPNYKMKDWNGGKPEEKKSRFETGEDSK